MDLIVQIKEHYRCIVSAASEIEPLYLEAMEPIKSTDEPTLAYALGEDVTNSEVYHRKVKLRKDAIAYIAAHVATILVEELQKQDTYNGYPILKQEE